MKCSDVRLFLSQVQSGGYPTVPLADLNLLASSGCLTIMSKDQYDQAKADIATMSQLYMDIQNETAEVNRTKAALSQDWRKTQSFSFHFVGGQQKQEDFARIESERTTISRDQTDIQQKEIRIGELIQKKSMIDRMVPYNGQYVSLTGQGVITLNDLNIRNYRVSDTEFSDYIQEINGTTSELRGIAQRGAFYIGQLNREPVMRDLSVPNDQMIRADFTAQLWSIAVGLAKLQGDPGQIGQRYLLALSFVKHFGSTIDSRMMAAEIMTSFRGTTSQSALDNSDLQDLSKSLNSIDHDVKHHGHVPGQISAGVSSVILSGRKYDGTFPLDRFLEYNKVTKSYESAAILSVLNVPGDQLLQRFNSFRSLFHSWAYEVSEDTELSSAYLSISGFNPEDVQTKMLILLQGLHNYLEYPIVAAAILASIPTLEANETLDLMEKAYAILFPYATGLQRSELVSLAVRMIHGIKNELVREIDPTAKLAPTPVQFTYAPGYFFFVYHRPLIIAHSSYYSTFSGFGGSHPAHVHGYGGGGFGG